ASGPLRPACRSPARELGPPPGWAGRGPSQDPAWLLKLSRRAGFGPADWPAQDAYPSHANGQSARRRSPERRPAEWLAPRPLRPPRAPPRPSRPTCLSRSWTASLSRSWTASLSRTHGAVLAPGLGRLRSLRQLPNLARPSRVCHAERWASPPLQADLAGR